MPFNRYLEDDDYSQDYEYSSHAPASSSQPYRGPGQVRLQIPQFISSGAPMLAPGGGAEILPAGMFSNAAQSGIASSWYANNGLTGDFPSHVQQGSSGVYMSQHSQSSAPVPIHYIHSPPDALSPRSATASTTSSYDFDNGPTSSCSDPKDSSQSALSLYVNSGLAAPRYPSHLNSVVSARSSPSFGFSVPSPLGLPVYSTTGFDLLSVLARVATRPNPQVALGPVDLTSSFAVVDVRRHDSPIIYCSPTFCRLTGYEEQDILGRNCRFLQSPNGIQPRGEIRRFTSHDAVCHIKKHLDADKEVQTSIVNYRKNGEAFINLVTIIPIRGGDIGMPSEDDKVVYHVGFQVDLNTQPQDIMQKVKDGSYIPNYIANDPVAIVPPLAGAPGSLAARDRKLHTIPAPVMSQQLKKLLEDRNFMTSFPITTVTNSDSSLVQTNPGSTVSAAAAAATSPTSASPSDASSPTCSSDLVNMGPTGNHPLSLILLEYAPDFIHIVSLKGSFLYVAPSVKRVLGYHPSELVGKSLSDICHPADSIPLMRELKESSATGPTALGSAGTSGGEDPKYYSNKPRPVDLLFRARTKEGKYVWVECRGRLHVEPGKGRKAIMLSGRAKEMSNFRWSAVASTGGLSRTKLVMGGRDREDSRSSFSSASSKGSKPSSEAGSPGPYEKVNEFWGTITRSGILLVVGSGCKDVLGWDELELIGRPIWNFLMDDDKKRRVGEELVSMGCAVGSTDAPGSLPSKLRCRMVQHNGTPTNVELVLYPSSVDSDILKSTHTISAAPIIYQIKLYDPTIAAPATLVHPLDENIFKDLETSRGTSWQYELQQLKYANDRLREEIKTLEGENGPVPVSGQLLSQKQQDLSTSVATMSPQAQHLTLPLSAVGPGPLAGYDHQHQQHHQGLGSASFSSAEHPSAPQSHSLYSSAPYNHRPLTANWSAVGNVNVNPMPGVPTSVAMPMSYAPQQQQQQQMMRFNNPTKRSWDSVDHGGPA
ncbi:hypothetical protein D9758_008716 [Tetrapyrgos nigripes]|uniref:PAS domain-containing protein n=1 Tax=Tetrapyrgos nigripes TaxID=182062 RepID=A0A8H5FXA2_9AGAR|nr:hypothetical protein D9758_008716 [Tetrapyrgos nigripes]